MALPEWMRTSVDAISLAQRLRRTGRQDLIDAVERGDTSLEAAVRAVQRSIHPGDKGESTVQQLDENASRSGCGIPARQNL